MYLYIYSQARSIVFKSRGGGRLVQKILTNKKKSKQISQNNKNHNSVGGVGWGVGVSVVHLILELHCSFFHFYFNFSFGLKKVGEGVNSLIIHLFIFELKKSLWCDKKCKNAANPPPPSGPPDATCLILNWEFDVEVLILLVTDSQWYNVLTHTSFGHSWVFGFFFH